MSFDQSTITSISYEVDRGSLDIDWISTSPQGTWFQVYVDDRLAARTRSTSVSIPKPAAGAQIHVGAVASSDSMVRFTSAGGFGVGGFGFGGFGVGSALPVSPANRVELDWTGGLFLDPLGTVGGFYIYNAVPSTGFGTGGFGDGGFGADGGYGTGGYGAGGFGGTTYTLDATPLANLPAYTSGMTTAGFGMGGFGAGGFGSASASYSWTSGPLTGGDWTFAVVAYDTAGNLGTPNFNTTTILAPPAPPALFSDGKRLHAVVTGGAIVLTWNPSPSGV
jgi:hypothetical protein